MRKILSIAALSLIAACGTVETDVASNDCSTPNWKSLGFQDGIRGLDSGAFGTRDQACSQQEREGRREAYQVGYNDGVAKFCTAKNGFNQGVTGYVYTGICPIALEDNFVKALKAGHNASKDRDVAGKL